MNPSSNPRTAERPARPPKFVMALMPGAHPEPTHIEDAAR